MLTKLENELLTRVGPGTPMGELVRRFWIPALSSTDLPDPAGDPVRVRLVGENFVAWRDGHGRVGFFDEYCMHRGASLAVAKCHDDGLVCLYHGWKFATDGTILETPNYKRSTVRDKLRAPVFPVQEAGGLIWVYLGPLDKQPPLPHWRFFDTPEDDILHHYSGRFDCNFMQLLEGTIDISHAQILHQDHLGRTNIKRANGSNFQSRSLTRGVDAEEFVCADDAPSVEVEDLTFGAHAGFVHEATADGRPVKYGRVSTWVMPFLTMNAPTTFVFNVPNDDQTTTFRSIVIDPAARTMDAEARALANEKLYGPESYYENGRYRFGEAEAWGQDRTRMREGSFTGVHGVIPEDSFVALSMGPVLDRSHEHLVPADALVIRVRRRLLQAARDLQAGVEPQMLGPGDLGHIGGWPQLLPDPNRWRSEIVPGHEPYRRGNTLAAEGAEEASTW